METLLISVFYPHDDKCILVKEGILPLIEDKELNIPNYFFSNHKGENITLQIECGNKEMAIHQIRDHFNSFVNKYGVDQPTVQLPLNQLFLNFPYNTLQVWEHNPFRKGILNESDQLDNDYQILLSNKCLHVISSEEQWNDSATFQVFIDLLFVVTVYIKENYRIEPDLILKEVLADLSNMSKAKGNMIQQIRMQGKDIYRQNQSGIQEYYHQAYTGITNNETHVDWIEDWLNILKARLRVLDNPDANGQVITTIKEVVMDTSQKIDLAQKGLIQAISVVGELIGSKD